MPLSPGLQTLIAGHEKLAALRGPAFLKELEVLLEEVKEEFFVTPEEKDVAQLDGSLRMIEKLGRFELSRKEWNEIGARRKAQLMLGSARAKEIQTLGNSMFSILNSQEAATFINFYEIAIKRESVFMNKISDLRRTSDSVRGTVFVSGGFHTDGLAAQLRKGSIPYVVVSPAMKEVPQDRRYFDHMQGKVSWQKYFRPVGGKVDLYDAFTRAATDKLLKDNDPLSAKDWRDSIIRQLAAEGRVAEHAKYTHFIDQQVAENSGSFQALKEKWTAKLEKFIEGLRFLHDKNQLTASEITRLLSTPANQTPVAVASFVPGDNMPQSFINSHGPSSELRHAEPSISRAEMRGDEDDKAKDFAALGIRGFVLNGKEVTPEWLRAKILEMAQGRVIFKVLIEKGIFRLGVLPSRIGSRVVPHTDIEYPPHRSDV
ncbi:MAG: hypothetical protein HY767_01450, partial [Candidatus Omnitrophica bacterium]|nr:hypothetical protein [Candidatus Omnitrophota bacterium]